MPTVDLTGLQATPTDRVVVAAAWDGDGAPGLPNGWTLHGASGRAAVIHRTGAPDQVDIPYTGNLDAYGLVALRIDGALSAASFPLTAWPDPDCWTVAVASPHPTGGSSWNTRPPQAHRERNRLAHQDPDEVIFDPTPRPALPASLRGGVVVARQGDLIAVGAVRAGVAEVVKGRLAAGAVPRAVIVGVGGGGLSYRLVWRDDLCSVRSSGDGWWVTTRQTHANFGLFDDPEIWADPAGGIAGEDWLIATVVEGGD